MGPLPVCLRATRPQNWVLVGLPAADSVPGDQVIACVLDLLRMLKATCFPNRCPQTPSGLMRSDSFILQFLVVLLPHVYECQFETRVLQAASFLMSATSSRAGPPTDKLSANISHGFLDHTPVMD